MAYCDRDDTFNHRRHTRATHTILCEKKDKTIKKTVGKGARRKGEGRAVDGERRRHVTVKWTRGEAIQTAEGSREATAGKTRGQTKEEMGIA